MYADFEIGILCETCAKSYYNTNFNSALQAKLIIYQLYGECSRCGKKEHATIRNRIKRK